MNRRLWVVAALAACGFIGAPVSNAETWTALVNSSYPGYGATESYSLRGIALSPDGSEVYGSWLHTGSGKTIVEYNSTTGAQMNSVAVPDQAKSLAVDSRGYVFAGTGDDNGDHPYIESLSSDLQTTYGQVTPSENGAYKRVGGLATWDDAGTYYLYATYESGSYYYIQRFNVTDPRNITLDNSWGTGGTLNIATLSGFSGTLNPHGIVVASDGTIYTAGTNTGAAPSSTNGTVFKVSADGSSVSSTSVAGAFDVAVLGNKLYVSEYGSGAPAAVAVLDANTLATLGALTTGVTNTNTSNDSGYSGIDISSKGNIYLADQFYTSPSYSDLLLKSSSVVPLPSAAWGGLALLGCLGLKGRMKRVHR